MTRRRDAAGATPVPRILLIGMMGSGKTTVGRIVAERLGWDFVDSDAEVVSSTGMTVAELFETRGEAGFRKEESRVLRESLAGTTPMVLSVAGGAVLDPANQELLRSRGTVVWMRAESDTLIRRIGAGSGRPLLQGDPVVKIQAYDRVRRPIYDGLAHFAVDVDDVDPATVAGRVVAYVEHVVEPRISNSGARRGAIEPTEPTDRRYRGPFRLEVALPDGRSYPVVVGAGVRSQLAERLPAGAKKVAIVTQATIPPAMVAGLATGREQSVYLIGDGETHKTLATVETLCSAWARWGMTRNDVVVAVGGGLVTDVGGFAAACYHRGIAVVHVPTTLLGMIDAAIGGKTAVNLAEGKNLVGAFWQPAAVVCDTDLLATLPGRELRSGWGELVKYYFLEPTVRRQAGRFLPTEGALSHPLEAGQPDTQQIARSVALKAAVVAADERESGLRATLNYGHTLAHALEIATNFELRHGEAVAIGLMYAATLAHRIGRISSEAVAEHRRILAGRDLPMRPPEGLDPSLLINLMGRDKKALHGLTFVLDGPNGVETVTGIPRSEIEAALAAM